MHIAPIFDSVSYAWNNFMEIIIHSNYRNDLIMYFPLISLILIINVNCSSKIANVFYILLSFETWFTHSSKSVN